MLRHKSSTIVELAIKSIIYGLILCHNHVWCNAQNDLFTSTADMKVLHDVQAILISNIKEYIEQQENKLIQLHNQIEFYEYHHKEASVNLSDYLSNPINVYLMTKRVTANWKQVEGLIAYDIGAGVMEKIAEHQESIKFPNVNDLNGAATGIARLQSAYNLDTRDMASGILNGVKYDIELTADDCYEIGSQLYYANNFQYALKWLLEAKSRLLDEDTKYDDELIINILAFLALTHLRLGNSVESFIISSHLLNKYEDEGREALKNVNHINEPENPWNNHAKMLNVIRLTDNGKPLPIMPEVYDIYQRVRFEKLCSQDIKRSPIELMNLRCQYVTNKSQFLRIAPLKLEELSHDPYIVMYVNVLYDSEIDKLQELAQPKLQRATIVHTGNIAKPATIERTSKSAWLNESEDKIIKNIELRSEDMMGLTVSTAESLQVVNYGIGGHYEPHYDFAFRGDITFSATGNGNRISTILFYMSDVEQGGATVFPYLNLAIWPRKGAAVVWHNLYKSGEGDNRTKHASCPVLVGNKWVCNKWFHEKDQDQLRPCSLQPDHPLILA